jgi:CubicO group peptidase (beta-lactamase class C family)
LEAPSNVSRALAAALKAARVPGCSAALVSREGVTWAGGFGWADLSTRRPAESDTVYHLFSGTKLFTATAVMQLVERGKVSLDDAATEFLPGAAALRGITIRDLLSHRSGLADSLRSFLSVTLGAADPPTTRDALNRYQYRVARPPREKVEYRNVNYAILGHVVTLASGVEYTEYVTNEILRPLGMKAGFRLEGSLRAEAATGYVQRLDPMRLLLWFLFPQLRGSLYGARAGEKVALAEFSLATPAIGGLVGSVVEWARFVQAHLAGGGPLLSSASAALMQTQVAAGTAGIESRVGVGLGWKVGSVDGRRFLNHEGGGAGFTSELRIYPDLALGVVIAMNAMSMPKTMRVAHAISEILVAHRDELNHGDPTRAVAS